MTPALHAAWKLSVKAALGGLLAGLAGCTAIGQVQPWEKGTLAKPEMTFGGNQLLTRYADHIYTSREAASGGAGVGGGGCGCN